MDAFSSSRTCAPPSRRGSGIYRQRGTQGSPPSCCCITSFKSCGARLASFLPARCARRSPTQPACCALMSARLPPAIPYAPNNPRNPFLEVVLDRFDDSAWQFRQDLAHHRTAVEPGVMRTCRDRRHTKLRVSPIDAVAYATVPGGTGSGVSTSRGVNRSPSTVRRRPSPCPSTGESNPPPHRR